MSKFAAIDIGSNTLLLLIVDDSSGELIRVVDECDFGRLGQGMAHSDALHPDAIDRSLEIVRRYRKIMDTHQISTIGCVATQALREAVNREAFIVPAETILGCNIELIAGEREAALVAGAVAHSFPELCQRQVVTVDVGGGSTEFIVTENQRMVSVKSIPIGAVRMSERYLKSDPPSPEEIVALMQGIDTALAVLDLPPNVPIVATAGTATTIASIKLALDDYQPDRIHGLEMSAEDVDCTLTHLLQQTLAEKKSLVGLQPERADVIAGGVAIYSRILALWQSSRFIVSDRGVRWGLAYELADH